MYDVVGAIYEMLGSSKAAQEANNQSNNQDPTSDESPSVRVDRIFELLDLVSAYSRIGSHRVATIAQT